MTPHASPRTTMSHTHPLRGAGVPKTGQVAGRKRAPLTHLSQMFERKLTNGRTSAPQRIRTRPAPLEHIICPHWDSACWRNTPGGCAHSSKAAEMQPKQRSQADVRTSGRGAAPALCTEPGSDVGWVCVGRREVCSGPRGDRVGAEGRETALNLPIAFSRTTL